MTDKNFDVAENNESVRKSIDGRSFGQIVSDNQNQVIRSYVTESKFNKGLYVLVVECMNGKKFVVSGQHHHPTYLEEYELSSDTKG